MCVNLFTEFIVLRDEKKKTPWSEFASELYRPSDRRLSAKWLPTCADRRYHVVSVTDSSGCISRFSRQESLLFYQVAPQFVLTRLSAPRSRPTTIFFWYFPESNPGLRICSQELWPLDHRGGPWEMKLLLYFTFIILIWNCTLDRPKFITEKCRAHKPTFSVDRILFSVSLTWTNNFLV
jgi:hypothetical protein